jgi:hypothetical protein
LQPLDLPLVLLVPLLEVPLIGHCKQRLGVGILGCLASSGLLFRKQPPSRHTHPVSCVQTDGLRHHRELVGFTPIPLEPSVRPEQTVPEDARPLAICRG